MITIGYCTARKEPRIEWFLDSLKNKLKDIPIQIIFVDYYFSDRMYQDNPFHKLFGIKNVEWDIIPPLPSFCQGTYKLTKTDYFDASTSRNTVLCHAKYPYVAMLDDLSVLGEHWLDSVIEGAQNKEIVLGAFRYDKNMIVENGKIVSSETEGNDDRWNKTINAKQQVTHPFFYGSSFAMPLELALEVNGFDTLCSMSGYEDQNFGHRLSKIGAKFFYDKRMLTVEARDLHYTEGNDLKRIDEVVNDEEYAKCMERFGISQFSNGQRDMSHAILEITRQNGHKAVWNNFDLRELRHKIQDGEDVTVADIKFPTHHWFTGKPLSEY